MCVRLGSCCLKISSPCGHYTLILLSWLLLVPIDIGSKAFRSHIKSLSQGHEDPLVFSPSVIESVILLLEAKQNKLIETQ